MPLRSLHEAQGLRSHGGRFASPASLVQVFTNPFAGAKSREHVGGKDGAVVLRVAPGRPLHDPPVRRSTNKKNANSLRGKQCEIPGVCFWSRLVLLTVFQQNPARIKFIFRGQTGHPPVSYVCAPLVVVLRARISLGSNKHVQSLSILRSTAYTTH